MRSACLLRVAHEAAILDELARLLAAAHAPRQPNIKRTPTRSSPPSIVGRETSCGGYRTAARRVGASAPRRQRTVVLYAHYDGQPFWPPHGRATRGTSAALNPLEEEAARSVGSRGRISTRSGASTPARERDNAPIIELLASLDAMRAQKLPRREPEFFLEGMRRRLAAPGPVSARTYKDRLRATSGFFSTAGAPTRRIISTRRAWGHGRRDHDVLRGAPVHAPLRQHVTPSGGRARAPRLGLRDARAGSSSPLSAFRPADRDRLRAIAAAPYTMRPFAGALSRAQRRVWLEPARDPHARR